MMCKYVDRSDLKSARLAFRELNDAAEISLFRRIYLRRNMDSFCRLRMISSTPHLAKLVKGIAYSGKMLRWENEDPDFDRWCFGYLGEGLRVLYKEDRVLLRKTLTMDDLHRLYSKWCGHLHSQRLMQRFGIEDNDLDDAFRKLPQLEKICFGPRASDLPYGEPITPELFSSLGREMLIEPDHFDGLNYHVGQFTAMMTAAHKNKKRLKAIRALDLGWKAFEQCPEVLAMMTANMRHCEHFTVKVSGTETRVDGEVQIASMVNNAPLLQAIGLTFPLMTYEPVGRAVELSRVFVCEVHWPHLKSLQLQGFSTYEIDLKKLLTAHTTSLQSLDLSRINLKPYESKGKLHHSSWVGLILFLQESLNLHKMRFRDSLTNEGSENWRVRDCAISYSPGTSPMGENLTFKSRVERYVVDGGEFPLPWPAETEGSRWKDLLIDFRPNLDQTWEFRKAAFRLLTYN